MKTIWIGADYPYHWNQGTWEVFTSREDMRPNTRIVAMVTPEHIPHGVETIHSDDACTIYRFGNIMFQISEGEITVG